MFTRHTNMGKHRKLRDAGRCPEYGQCDVPAIRNYLTLMKKQIPWPYLIFGGLILHCAGYLGGGVITSAIGV